MITYLEKELITLERYLKNQGRMDFIQDMRKSTPDVRESKLLSLAKHKQEIISTMKEDAILQKAQNEVKTLKAPYTEQKRMNEKLSRFIHLIAKD